MIMPIILNNICKRKIIIVKSVRNRYAAPVGTIYIILYNDNNYYQKFYKTGAYRLPTIKNIITQVDGNAHNYICPL